jgi:acyl carrier protein
VGLESVELVLAIEDAFKIEIPDRVAPDLGTVGDMHRYILEQLRSRGERVVETEIWNKLRDLIVDQIGVRPEEVIPTASFIEDLGMD